MISASPVILTDGVVNRNVLPTLAHAITHILTHTHIYTHIYVLVQTKHVHALHTQQKKC